MRKLVIVSCIVLSLLPSAFGFGQVDKNRKIVAMLIPNPKAPSTAEKYDSPTTKAAYNTITSYLIEHNVSVIDKDYVDQALEELKNKKDLDIDVASIEYGKKNTADRAILFYVTDKSASFTDKHFECTLKAINVRTGQVKAIVTAEGVHREDKENAAKNAAKAAIEEALAKIIEREDLCTVTFIGNLNLKVQDKLDNVFANLEGVKSFDGYLVDENKYEYRVSYLYNVQTLRNRINQASRKIGYKLELDKQSINSLAFYLLPTPNIHNRLRTVAALLVLGSAAATGTSYYFASDNFKKYQDAKTYSEVVKYRKNTQDWDKYTAIAAGGTAVSVLWYWFEAKHAVSAPQISKKSLGLYVPKADVYGLSLKLNF